MTASQNTKPCGTSNIILVAAGILGLLARPVLSALSYGTNDVTKWGDFARIFNENGLAYLYSNVRLFNHPPLIAPSAGFFARLSEHLAVPFPFAFRLPGILAEVLSAILLWKICDEKYGTDAAAAAFAVFGTSLILVLISGYHGNTDSIYAFLCLLSVYLFTRGYYASSGLSVAVALNVKLIPLLVVICLAFNCHNRKQALRFASGLLPGVLPYIAGAVIAGEALVRNVFQYSPQFDYWGVNLFLLLMHSPSSALLWGKLSGYIVLIAALFSGVLARRGRLDIYQAVSLASACFLILSPAVGKHYFALFIPFACVTSAPWAFRISVAAGIYALAHYAAFLVSLSPLRSEHVATSPKPVMFLGFITWIALVAFVLSMLHSPRRHS